MENGPLESASYYPPSRISYRKSNSSKFQHWAILVISASGCNFLITSDLGRISAATLEYDLWKCSVHHRQQSVGLWLLILLEFSSIASWLPVSIRSLNSGLIITQRAKHRTNIFVNAFIKKSIIWALLPSFKKMSQISYHSVRNKYSKGLIIYISFHL